MGLILQQALAAMAGTFAFSLLFGVPRKYEVYCGVIGGAGWLVYAILTHYAILTATEATFVSTVFLTILCRCAAVIEKCPVTVFQTTGIFPLVPGAGIYWTSYYLVTGEIDLASKNGFAAVKAALAIVLGIIIVFEIPNSFFGFICGRRNKHESNPGCSAV